MPFPLASRLATAIPPGSARPSWGVVLFAVVALMVVIGLNALWEIKKGPPNP